MRLEDTISNVRVDNETSKDLQIEDRLRQGDPLSALLLTTVLEKIIWDSLINTYGHIVHKGHQVVGYADDVALRAMNEKN